MCYTFLDFTFAYPSVSRMKAMQRRNRSVKNLTNGIKNIVVLTMVKYCLLIIIRNITGLQTREKKIEYNPSALQKEAIRSSETSVSTCC